MSMPTVIFMGSKPGSIVALEYLLMRGWIVACVVVSKTIDYPWYGGNDLKKFAEKHGIPVYFQSDVPSLENVDYIISYMYRHLVKTRLRMMAKYASINFHAAPLPEFGGWGTYNRAILNDSDYFGCTCHHMCDGFDDGPIVSVRKFKINPQELTAFDLEQLAQEEMVKLFIDIATSIENDRVIPSLQQNRSDSQYLSMEQMNELKVIPADASIDVIEKYARAFWFPPHQGAYIDYRGMKIEVVPSIIKKTIAETVGSDVYKHLRNIMIMHKH